MNKNSEVRQEEAVIENKKQKDCMESPNLEDSCILEEPHISLVVLDDTIVEDKTDVTLTEEDKDTAINNNEETIMKVVFSNGDTFSEYKNKVIELLSTGLRTDTKLIDIIENETDHTLEVNERCGDGDELIFSVDTKPASKISELSVPNYLKSKFAKIGTTPTVKNLNEKKNEPQGKGSCFNCGENHLISDCEKPRDFARINRARTQFNSTNQRVDRYHVETQQKFGHFSPGVLTDELKQALGLRSGELPMHIYRMRELGYPPGWLEDAKVLHSGLNMFDSQGSKILEDEEEDGEVATDKDRFDQTKIIDFPGFNVKPKRRYIDEHISYKAPPMSDFQSKDFMLETLRDRLAPAYKRSKLKNLPGTIETSGIRQQPVNMEIEDGEVDDDDDDNGFCGPMLPPGVSQSPPPLPTDDIDLTNNPPPPPPAESPTLDDLEEKQQKLLDALNSSEVTIANTTTEIVWQVIDETTPETVELQMNESIQMVDDSIITISECSTPSTPVNTVRRNHSLSELSGTPVLQFSPYDKLPSGEKFSVGVCDVINFENLPDSTGKYEQMRGLLGKVREKLKRLHDDDD